MVECDLVEHVIGIGDDLVGQGLMDGILGDKPVLSAEIGEDRRHLRQ